MIRIVALALAAFAVGASPALGRVKVAPTPEATATPAPTPAPVPAGVDVTDYARAFAYWKVERLDPERCPHGPIAIYDHAQVSGRHAFALGELGGCRWFFGDAYLAAAAEHRCYAVVHEIGHLLGYGHDPHPNDPHGVMAGPFRLGGPCSEHVVGRPDPMAVALLASRQREAEQLARWSREWEVYDRAAVKRERVFERRDRCIERAGKAKRAKARKRGRKRCRARYTLPPLPKRPPDAVYR